MTQVQLEKLYQLQVEQIAAIIEGELAGTSVARFPPASIDTRFPVVVPTLQGDLNSKPAHTVYAFETTWRLYLYLAKANQGLETVNNTNVYLYIAQFYKAFLSRRGLTYSGEKLPYSKDSSIQLVSAMNDAQRYPPRGGQVPYWGCVFDLTIYSTNIKASAIGEL